ncbi:LPS assembly protein LptD, partial [Pseudomonas aeruginosa]
DRRVQLPGLSEKDLDLLEQKRLEDPALPEVKRPDTDSWRSPYALAGLYRFNRDWNVTSDFNWNPNTSRTESG